VQDLKKRGIDAAAVDSTMERDEVLAVFERVMNDEVRLLYVSLLFFFFTDITRPWGS
jgi:superfamily II DNA helicase RecQ